MSDLSSQPIVCKSVFLADGIGCYILTKEHIARINVITASSDRRLRSHVRKAGSNNDFAPSPQGGDCGHEVSITRHEICDFLGVHRVEQLESERRIDVFL